MAFLDLGKNVKYQISANGKELTVKMSLDQDFGKSGTGKSVIHASTSGNKPLPNGMKLGINLYTPI
jgi:hypothetical protein